MNQLFDDLQTLVSQQGEVVVQIGDNAETAAQDLKQGTRFAQRAIDSARSARAVSLLRYITGIFSSLTHTLMLEKNLLPDSGHYITGSDCHPCMVVCV